MLLESATLTLNGVLPSFVLGLIGFFLLKRNILQEEGLDMLSRLVIEVTLPLLIFYRLLSGFDFGKYPEWWTLPLLSFLITLAGFLAGLLFVKFVKGEDKKVQFLSLVSFQNSGYLPLVMLASMLTGEKLNATLIYLFLFLLGFNLLLFSFGVYLLTFKKGGKLELKSFFNAPVLATFIGFAFVVTKLNALVPPAVAKAIGMAGDCTMPLAMFVVGGNIAAIKLKSIDARAMTLMVLAKLILLPAAGLALVYALKLPDILGLLIVLQLAMPPATNLSVLVRQYKQEDQLVSQGIFFGHVAALVTIPVFLSLYFVITMLK
jgi:malate permease and related proteins